MKRSKTDIFRKILIQASRQPRGQSFVELMLVLVFLTMLLAGAVEFGFLLNNYLHVLDGAREAARYSSSAIAYDLNSGATIPEFYYYTAVQAANTLVPVKLDPTKGDDIIISVISAYESTVLRHPSANGWSLCGNYDAFVNYLWAHDPNHPSDPLQSVPPSLADVNWYSCSAHASRINDAAIVARLDPCAPNAGVLMVEILYDYPQMLKLPVFSNNTFFGVQFSLVPDPIPVYVYSIMPISSAEPKQVRIPC